LLRVVVLEETSGLRKAVDAHDQHVDATATYYNGIYTIRWMSWLATYNMRICIVISVVNPSAHCIQRAAAVVIIAATLASSNTNTNKTSLVQMHKRGCAAATLAMLHSSPDCRTGTSQQRHAGCAYTPLERQRVCGV
jgi:hypothetical protein